MVRTKIKKTKDIVIGMMQSLAFRQYPSEVYDHFGLIIIDEAHRIGAREFHKALVPFRAKYRLGLSGTFRRADGCENIFYWHIGPVVSSIKRYDLNPTIMIVYTGIEIRNDLPTEVAVNVLTRIERRNGLIVSYIDRALSKGRKVIVFSSRLAHLNNLAAKINSKHGMIFGFYIGGRKQSELDLAAKARVIFATTQMAKEGLDIPDIDTVLLTVPFSDVEQDIGRILRLRKDKQAPVVVDFVDAGSMPERKARRRMMFYQKKKFKIVRSDHRSN